MALGNEKERTFIEKVFAPDGYLASFHEDHEYRTGQIDMARKAAESLKNGHHLIVEAGTGTGKTLAYLTPAIDFALARKTRVVISTGTKNLQEQLMDKDIPFLQKVLPKKFSAAYMKGRANYACIHRINSSEGQPLLGGIDEIDHFKTVAAWSHTTSTGDRAELLSLPENLPFWNRINARGEVCLGQKCPDYEPCFITRMRQRAENADLIIVNHHLFFADLSLRNSNFGRVIPDYGAVIFDEAHLIEDIAADYFGVQISSYQLDEILRDAASMQIANPMTASDIGRQAGKAGGIAEQFWAKFTSGRGMEGRFPLDGDLLAVRKLDGSMHTTPIGETFEALDASLAELERTTASLKDEPPDAEAITRRISQARFDLAFVLKRSDSNFVYWLERRGRGVFFQASPIDISTLLEEKLFTPVASCVLTSATLSASNKFDFVIDRLGIERSKTDTFIAPATFDHESQALLYIPRSLPDPRSIDYSQRAADEIIRILDQTHGRAFILCTSNSSMEALYELVSSRVGYPCLLQGQLSKSGLIERFRETANAVLFATSSFWQGVDVRGDQLSCVIIDKLPFAVPTDPLVAARSKFIDDNGGRSFFDYSVPQAIISLKQGIGRLIRSRTDKGVIALLDPRLRSKPYGKQFLASLPRMRITAEIGDIGDFLSHHQE